MQLEPIVRCRSCGGERLHIALELGDHCVSDFVENGGEPDRAPLTLVCCEDCTLVQLYHTVPRERLYQRYWYRSGTNESMVAALLDVVKDPYCYCALREGGDWLDIGANDGTLLRLVWQEHMGTSRHGFEPADNLAHEAARRGGATIFPMFFPPAHPDLAARLGQFNVITSIAMFYDLDDPNEFCQAIKRYLHPDGVWIIQMSTLERMLEMNAFDNICHEHLEYYSVRSLWPLLSRHGLHIAGISGNRVNGGSLRFAVKHGYGAGPPSSGPDLAGVQIRCFADRVSALRTETLRVLGDLRDAGKLVLGYGASTKGNTLLQYYGIGPDLLPGIADRDPAKWGRHTVGSGIPIMSEREMREFAPDYALILPWHFLESFVQRERSLLERGMRFIVPLPQLQMVGLEDVATACLGLSGE